MTKKIVINASILDENPTGLGIYAKNVIKELIKYNKNLKIFSPVDIKGVEVEKISKYVKPSYKKKGGLARLLWTQLVFPFKLKKDDIVYHPFQYLSLLSNAKQIITIHDFIPMHYPQVAKHQYRYYKYFMPLLLKKAYKIVCISENTKRDLIKFYNTPEEKVSVIYNGYDKETFNTKNVDKSILKQYNMDCEYMLMVGATHTHKNLEVVIKAFTKIESNCKLVIVGKDSHYIIKLKKLVEDLKIKDKVMFVGYVPDEHLPTLYHYSKSFVYPTLYEGFGLPILEAMACETSVICSNNSSLPEVYGDAALTFDPKSQEDVENKIKLFLSDDSIKEELIIKSKEVLKKFSWENTSKELWKILN